MENICVAEASSSSDPSCDERVSEISSLAQVTSNRMAAASRPCDPRDFKKSRAYQFKALDQNVYQLDRKVTQERSAFALDRSILTPITDGDQVNDIKMIANSTDECDVFVSEEAVVDLAIDNRVDMSIPEVVDMVLENMDVGDSKKEDSTTEGNRKEDSLTIIEGVMEEQNTEAENRTQSGAVLAKDKMERIEDAVVVVQDKTETENRKDDTVMVVKDKMEVGDRKENTVVMVEDKMEAEENIKEDSTIILEDKTDTKEKESVLEAEKEEEKVEAVEDSKEKNVVVEARVEDDVIKDKNKDDKMEVDKVREKEDKMEVEEPLTEQFKTMEHMDTTLNVDSSNKSLPANSVFTASKMRVKNELFCFNPEPIDDDLVLPSCNELSNQVLSNNLLRDIENLSDSMDSQLPIGPSISRVLSKPLIPSCSAFRSSVLSNVTSTARSGSSHGKKQSLKDTTFTKSPRKGSSPRKIVSKTPEKSVSKKSVSKKNSESSEDEKAATTAVEIKPIKPKSTVEQVRKYSTRRTALLEETKQVENKPQAKPAPSVEEKLLIRDTEFPIRDTKLSPNKQSSGLKDKSLSKPPQLNIKTSKQNSSPSKTPTKSPLRTMPTRTPLTRQSAKLNLSPHMPSSSTSPSTKSHTKSIAKATVSSSDPIPVWITWKCCLCSRGSSQDQLGFLYGPYKSQTDDCVSVGSKRTHDDTDSDSVDEKPAVSELWVHEGCACWAPGVCLVGTELHGLAEAVKNAKDMECVGCHQPGATISCSNRGCKASFHYPCAIKAGCSLLPDQLLLLCQTHDTQEKTV